MGLLADRLDRMLVSVALPGDRLRAELSGRGNVTVSFARGYYQATTEAELERELTILAELLWQARMREYHAALRLAFRRPVFGDRPARGPRDLAYRRARDQLIAEGRSGSGRIAVSVKGMRDWRVRIEPGALRELDEREFVEEARTAAAELIRDQVRKIVVLKTETFGAS